MNEEKEGTEGGNRGTKGAKREIPIAGGQKEGAKGKPPGNGP